MNCAAFFSLQEPKPFGRVSANLAPQRSECMRLSGEQCLEGGFELSYLDGLR
jgi:hypothetical protein